MGDGIVSCGEAGVYSPTGAVVRCIARAGHPTPMHHSGPPTIMYWPVDAEVTCSAWRTTDTAMGPVVVRCVLTPGMHRPTEHEGRIGIQAVAWTDADIDSAGRVAVRLAKLIAEHGYEPGDMLPTLHDLGKAFRVGTITIKRAMMMLERDGVVRPKGQRWVKA